MSVPKQRHTKGRRNRRRANIKINPKNFVTCSQCKKNIKRHTVCPYCGYYKGKKVLNVKQKSKRKTKAGRKEEK